MSCCNFLSLSLILAMALISFPGHGQGASCANCHGWRKAVTERRTLSVPHDGVKLAHGQVAGLWCLDCHQSQNPALLKGKEGQGVPFVRAEESCLVCHNRQVKDWTVGVHGKREKMWQGDRTVLSCRGCHNPHAPRFANLTPSPPPSRPKGLP